MLPICILLACRVSLCELTCGACGALITVRGVCTSSRVICFLLFAADCTLPYQLGIVDLLEAAVSRSTA
jgi:hypothetical protein